MQLSEIVSKLAQWSATKPLVARAWIFGSWARGEETQASDLGIALELDLSAAQGADESGGAATWMFETTSWKSEIARIFPYVIDLEQYLGEQTPTILRALERSSVLAYAK